MLWRKGKKRKNTAIAVGMPKRGETETLGEEELEELERKVRREKN